MKKTKNTILAFVAILLTPMAANADPIGTVQTFDDATLVDGDGCTGCFVNGWFGEFAPDAGRNGLGDDALRYDSLGFGFHLLTWLGRVNPDEAFLGNYLEAGVLGVQFDAKHLDGDDLFLRAFIFDDDVDGFGGTYSSTAAHISADATEWTTYTIWFSPDDLLLSPYNDPFQSAADILFDVYQFGLRHDPGGDGPANPDRVSAVIYFDNVRLITVPEPGTLTLFGIGLLGMGLARRRKKI